MACAVCFFFNTFGRSLRINTLDIPSASTNQETSRERVVLHRSVVCRVSFSVRQCVRECFSVVFQWRKHLRSETFFLFLFCFSFFKWKFVNIRSHFDCVWKKSEKFSYFSIVELLLLSVTGRWEGEKRRRRRRPQLTPSMRAIGIILSCFNNNNNQRSKKSSSSVVRQRRRRPLWTNRSSTVDPTVQHVARVSQNIFSFFEGILTAEKEKQQVDSIPKNKTKGRNKTKTEQRFFPAGGCAPYWIVVTVQHLHPWLSVLLILSLLHSLERRPLPPPPFPPVSLVVG